MLSDFLNVTLEEASSNKLSEATNFSAMAQVSFTANASPTAGPVIGCIHSSLIRTNDVSKRPCGNNFLSPPTEK